jgi:hypothetical protein
VKSGIELRCPHHKHAEVVEEFIEVRCRKPRCGYAPGMLVIHRFDQQGNLVETRRFREPPGGSTKEG